MRIIAGKFKGRRFSPPAKNWPTRPTTDFSKEGLFNILQNRIDFEKTKMLDLFGGTGNHSYEFISRGCRDVTYVDNYFPCTQFVKSISKELEIEEYIKVIRSDVFRFIQRFQGKFNYIFAGPPYPLPHLMEIPDSIFKHDLLEVNGLLIIEHSKLHNFEDHSRFMEYRKYGSAIFSFFQ